METRSSNRSLRGNTAPERPAGGREPPSLSQATSSTQPLGMEEVNQQQRLEDEERALRTQLDILRQEKRVAALRQQVAALRAGDEDAPMTQSPNDDEPVEGQTPSIDDDESTTSSNRRRRDSEGPEPRLEKKPRLHVRIPDPRPYRASSHREYVQYVRMCEQHFEADPVGLASDARRALFVSAFSEEGEIQDAIYRMLEDAKPAIPQWEELKAFLRNLLTPEHQRSQDAARLYFSAKQRPGQTTNAFITYLEGLEENLPESTDETRLAHLKQALRSDILAEILPLPIQPTTRGQLIESAQRAEQVIMLRAKIQRESRDMPYRGASQTTRPSERFALPRRPIDRKGWKETRERVERVGFVHPPSQPPLSAANSSPIAQGKRPEGAAAPRAARDKTNDTCRSCQQKGHWKAECPARHQGKQRSLKGKAQ